MTDDDREQAGQDDAGHDEGRADEAGSDGNGAGQDRKAADARTLHRTVREEGEDELDRPVASLWWSGLAAGIAINTSLLAEGALHAALPDAPWRPLVVALGYPLGFLLVILGRLQFFTETTITAMLPLATRPSWRALGRTARLWAVVLAANLVGTAIAGGSVAAGLLSSAEAQHAMVEIAQQVTQHDAFGTLLNAVPAGFLIAMIAWVLPNARQQSLLVIVVVTYMVAIGRFSHSIVGADEAFLLLFSGRIGVTQLVFGIVGPAVVGNLVGGAGIFALIAHAQVRGEMVQRAD